MPTAPAGVLVAPGLHPSGLGLQPSGPGLLAPPLVARPSPLQRHRMTCSKDSTHCCEAALGRKGSCSLMVYSHWLASVQAL